MKRGVKNFIQAGLITGLLVGLVPFGSASAVQDTTGVTESILLTPTQKRYEIAAGQTKRDSFKVVNDGQSAYTFVVYARPYFVTDESYRPVFETPTADQKVTNADAYKWVQFDQPSYQIQPGQTIDVNYTVRIPANASPGGHYGVLFAETQPEQAAGGNSVRRTKRVGSILYTTVDGQVTTSGAIKSTSIPFFQFKPPLTASQRISSDGNTDITVTTKASVSDVFGAVKYKNERAVAVLPSTTRNIETSWEKASWIGLYKVTLETSFLDTKSTESRYVLLVPVWVYLVLVGLIIARIGYGVVLRRKK